MAALTAPLRETGPACPLAHLVARSGYALPRRSAAAAGRNVASPGVAGLGVGGHGVGGHGVGGRGGGGRQDGGQAGGPEAGAPVGASVMATGVQEDSRLCLPGDVFVAIAGTRADGLRHARAAVEAGAVAIASERDPAAFDPALAAVPWIAVDDARAAAGRLADLLYGDPSRSLALVGVTGTNGKTTVATLLRQLLPGRVAFLGTTGIEWPGRTIPATHTTPGPTALRRHLREMVLDGCDACAAEVSSHALDQRRVDGLRFSAAVFTNLSGDHLDYHGSMEAYASAKARLFALLEPDAPAVLNAEDPVARSVRTRGRRILFRAERVESSPAGTHFLWRGRPAFTALPGRHNAENAAAALEAACALGVAPDEALARLREARPARGRLEAVQRAPFAVLVDYAHTDDALDKALRAVRGLTGGALHVVFGCGGDRDRSKRPRMGAVAARLADHLWITNDNPRSEDPAAIAAEILAGCKVAPGPRSIEVILDRRAAIRGAIACARPGDSVLIAGKGHEDYQLVGAERRTFDDAEEARAALARDASARPGTAPTGHTRSAT